MAETKEQVTPLAPANNRILIDDHKHHDDFPAEFPTRRPRQKCIKCCGCSAAIILILAMVVLILMLTVLRVKDPVIKMNSINIDGLDFLNNNTRPLRGLNLTVVADVSIKNPNVASFEFDNATTKVYYDGGVVGEVSTPAGRAGARRTMRMNVSVDVMVDKILRVERFESDLIAGIFGVSACTRISGKVEILDFIERHVVVRMNCTMNVNVRGRAVQDRNCRRRVSL